MKFEALKPKSEPEIISPEEREEKAVLIKDLENKINEVELCKENLKKEMDQAEKTGDWVAVDASRQLLGKALSQAKSAQRKLEGGGESLVISTEYKYKDEKGKEVKETIELDFETSVSSMVELYTKYGIELPPDFIEQMKGMWQKNIDDMTDAVAEKGFNQVLFIPGNLPKPKELEEKMTKGYEEEKGNKTYWGTKADSIIENVSNSRIVLVHKAPDLTAHPELKKTLGKEYGGEKENGKDNKAADFVEQGESLTLSEYLILQREVFDKTGVHLDSKKTPDGNYIYWTWLPGSKVGTRVVRAGWSPDDGRLHVNALDPDSSYPDRGCRLSRCFF